MRRRRINRICKASENPTILLVDENNAQTDTLVVTVTPTLVDANATQTDALTVIVKPVLADSNANQTDAVSVASFNPLVVPGGSATSMIMYDSDNAHQTGGIVDQMLNLTSWTDFGSIINPSTGLQATFFGGAQNPTFTASNPSFNGHPSIDSLSGGLQRFGTGIPDGIGGLPANPPQTWVFVYESTAGDNLRRGLFRVGSPGGTQKASPGEVETSGSNMFVGAQTLVAADPTNGGPKVEVFVWDAAGTWTVYSNSHTAIGSLASGTPPGTISGASAEIMSTGFFNQFLGSMAAMQWWTGAMIPSDVAYILDGFGAKYAIPITP